MRVREVRPDERDALLAIVNDAAQAYRGVIPADRWHEPYMARAELEAEIADGVEFWGAEQDGRLLGVMGIQDKGEVALVRHAYVATAAQGKGVGQSLLRHVQGRANKPLLVGTWAAAAWAIEFYRRNGFALVPQRAERRLAAKILVDSRTPDRNVGRAREPQSGTESGGEAMNLAANIVVALVALLHLYFLVLEMFLWDKPAGLRAFGQTPQAAAASKVLAANQGLYNGFLAAGLVWGLAARRRGHRGEDLLPRLRADRGPVRRRHREPQDPRGAGAAGGDRPRAGAACVSGAR